MKRERRAWRGRAPEPQAAPAVAADPLPGGPRRGLVKRARAVVARRTIHRVLTSPAAAPVVAVVVGAVLTAVVIGVVLGVALAAASRAGEWDA
jgi:hypothetical protein